MTRVLADTATRRADARAWLAEMFPAGVLAAEPSAAIRLALLDRSAFADEGSGWDELQGFRMGAAPFTDASHDELLDVLAASVVASADRGLDVFACPYPHSGRRRKGAATARLHVHADVDGPLDMARVEALGAFAVASGSTAPDGLPHGHAYLRLSEPVDSRVHEALCRALGVLVGGHGHDGSKVGDADVLRPVGTLNHKRGGERPVSWLVRPDAPTVRTWQPELLARLLGLGWPIADRHGDAQREHVEHGDDELTERRIDGLVRAVAEAEPHRGNDALLWAACRVHEAGGAPDALERLADAFASRSSREPHGQRLIEAHRTIASAGALVGRAGSLDAHVQLDLDLTVTDDERDDDEGERMTIEIADDADVGELRDDHTASREAIADGVRAAFPLLDLAALLDPDRPARRWLLDGIVPEGDHVSIVAPGGVGKSLLALALSVAAVRGDGEFLGRRVTSPRRVLYLDMENSEDDWFERLDALAVTRDEVSGWAGRFLPLSFPRLDGLDTPTGARQLAAVLDAYEVGAADLVVLDSTQRVTEGDENSNDTIRKLYNLTSAELKRRGITVLRTDNTGHEGDRARGASAKRDDVAMSWLLARVDGTDDCFTLKPTKRRAAGSSDGLTFQRVTDAEGVLHFVQINASTARTSYDLARDALDLAGVAHTEGVHKAWSAVQALAGGVPDGVKRAHVRAVQSDRKLAAEAVIV